MTKLEHSLFPPLVLEGVWTKSACDFYRLRAKWYVSQISELVIFDVIYYSCSFLCGKYRVRILSPQTCLYAEKALLWPSEDPLSSFRRSGGRRTHGAEEWSVSRRSGGRWTRAAEKWSVIRRSGGWWTCAAEEWPVSRRSGGRWTHAAEEWSVSRGSGGWWTHGVEEWSVSRSSWASCGAIPCSAKNGINRKEACTSHLCAQIRPGWASTPCGGWRL